MLITSFLCFRKFGPKGRLVTGRQDPHNVLEENCETECYSTDQGVQGLFSCADELHLYPDNALKGKDSIFSKESLTGFPMFPTVNK